MSDEAGVIEAGTEESNEILLKSDQPIDDKPVDDKPADDKLDDKPADDDKPSDDDKPADKPDDKPSDDKPADDEIKDDKPTDDKPVDDKDNKGGGDGKANSGSEDTPEVQTEKFNSRLSESLGEDFKSIDDVKSHISDLEAAAKPVEFSNDVLSKFDEFMQGRNMDSKEGAVMFLETQVADFNEMDPIDLIRFKYERDHPNISDEEIDFLIQDKYKLDKDNEEYSEREVKLAKIQMSTDADTARKELIELQEKIAMKPAPEKAAASEVSEEDKEKQAKADEIRQQEADESMKDFKSLSLPISEDGEDFTFGVDDITSVKNVVNDPLSFLSRYDIKDKAGKVIGADLNKFRDDMTFIQNKEAICKALDANGASRGKEEMLNERKNPKDVDNGGDGGDEGKSEAEQLGAVMAAAGKEK